MNNKITDLEIRITHQEACIDELTRSLLDQEKRVKKLEKDLDNIRDQFKEFSNVAHASEETPPPHY